ncbi:MAG: RnfABCDGE type electron transport complex subunit D [Pseudohongiellaceae bacterium]
MKTTIYSPPRQNGNQTVSQMMKTVIYCLCPGIILSTWFFGIGVLLNIAVALITALLIESLCLKLRGRTVAIELQNFSIVVTAILFAISIPPGTTWTLVVAGIGFAVIVGKHIYGGLGQNPFNPAMAGYLFLLLSFPSNMTTWHIPVAEVAQHADNYPLGLTGIKHSLVASFPFILFDSTASQNLIDGMAMATPLIEYKMASPNALAVAWESRNPLWSPASDTGWELINLSYLIGGIVLLAKGIIRWQIPTAILCTVAALAMIFYTPSSAAITGTPYMHLLGSATMLGAFFIATDPVSAATTKVGRLIYGVLIGVIIYSIRVWGSYLDAVAIAIIFANFCAPLLDYFFQPRVYGKPSSLTQILSRKAP